MKVVADLTLTSAPHRAHNTWSPEVLFEGGVQGVWYDPTDLTSVWADTSGTIPAALDGAVARMDDLSGNGHHAIEATTAARPILREDGAGRRYLEFDGVDDRIAAPTIGFNAQDEFLLAYVGSVLEGSGRLLNPGTSNDRFWGVASDRWLGRLTVSNLDSAGYGFDLTNLHVGEFALQNGQADLTCNGVVGPIAATVGEDLNLSNLCICARSDGAAALAMNFYGFVAVAGGAAATQRAKVRSFLAARAGVSV